MYYPLSAGLESAMEFFMEIQGNPTSLFSCGDSCDAGAVIWDYLIKREVREKKDPSNDAKNKI